jgi:predicted TIM-barrel fold metal-dependent hydrolase
MAASYGGPIVDVDLHHNWRSQADVIAYLPERWREYASSPAAKLHTGTAGSNFPEGNRRHDAFHAPDEPAVSDFDHTRRLLIDVHNFWRVVVTYDVGHHGNTQNPYFGTAIARASNDWNADTWLTYDERLYGVVAVNLTQPVEAAAEIRRIGQHSRMCATLFAGSPLGRPYGDPIYDPVWEASAELGLPVDIHLGVAPMEREAGGRPETDLASVVPAWAVMMHNVTSMIVHGVFEKWPGMRVLIKEVGTLWLAPLMWRLDRDYELLRRESPWVRRLPSDYIREHIKLGTQPIEDPPRRGALKRFYEATEMADMLCFASDYAHTTFDDPTFVARRMPDGWARKVMCDNACQHYGWTSPQKQPAAGQLIVGARR